MWSDGLQRLLLRSYSILLWVVRLCAKGSAALPRNFHAFKDKVKQLVFHFFEVVVMVFLDNIRQGSFLLICKNLKNMVW
jgi:hypothetical protein